MTKKKTTRREPLAFRLLSVSAARKHFKKTPNVPIHFVDTQDFGTYNYDKNEKPTSSMILTGDLIEEKFGAKKQKIHKGWLFGNEPGPYKRGASVDTFYHLAGKYKDMDAARWEEFKFQICSKPANTLSLDCLDAIDCWVKK